TPSSPPSDRAAPSTAASRPSRSVTSAQIPTVLSPSSSSSSSSRSFRRASIATEPPQPTIERHAAAPMPLDAPVTSTGRPARSTLTPIPSSSRPAEGSRAPNPAQTKPDNVPQPPSSDGG